MELDKILEEVRAAAAEGAKSVLDARDKAAAEKAAEEKAAADKIEAETKAAQEAAKAAAAQVAGVQRQYASPLAAGLPAGMPTVQNRFGRLAPKWANFDEKAISELSAEDRGTMAARCVRYAILSKSFMLPPYEIARQHGDQAVADAMERQLGQDTLAGGGALIPPEFMEGVIELLRANNTVLKSPGLRRLPMKGTLTMPRRDSGSTASYIGENTNTTASEPTFGQVILTDKKLTVQVPVSNDLLRNSEGSHAADVQVRMDMIESMDEKLDITLIRAVGSSFEPQGLLFQAATANKFNGNNTFNFANFTEDANRAQRLLEDNNVKLDFAKWLFSPRTKFAIQGLTDGNGNDVYGREMRERGTLFGLLFDSTSQIPNNLGGGTDESEMYLTAFDHEIFAESRTMEMNVFPGGTFFDGTSLQSGIAQDQTIFSGLWTHDFQSRQSGKNIVVIQAITWGA